MSDEAATRGSFHRITIPILVHDTSVAIAFYRPVFEAEADPEDPCILYPGGVRTLGIRLIADADARAAGEEEDQKTPRCELVVDDIDAWIARAVSRGAKVDVRLTDEKARPTYAQFIDPFGHRWALASPADITDDG
jgi:PhnB protein